MATPTKVKVPARLSYANIWEPKAVAEGQEPKYSVSLIVSKDDEDTIAAIEKAVDAAIVKGKEKFGKAFSVASAIKRPIRDGDLERPEDEAYANAFFVNANSKSAPKIVNRQLVRIDNPDEVYSGCYTNVIVNFYPFNTNGNKGIAAGLGNIQFIRDGERLGGASTPEEDFDILEDEDDLLSF